MQDPRTEMMEPLSTPPPPAAAEPDKPGCLGGLATIALGFVLSTFSPTFYRKAVKAGIPTAIGFLTLFGVFMALLQTVSVGVGASSMRGDIQTTFTEENFPEAVITNGTLSLSGGQETVILYDAEGILIAYDTTDNLLPVDRSRADQALVFGSDRVGFLDDDGSYQEADYDDLQDVIGIDPIIINAETLTGAWSTFVLWLTGVVFVVQLLGHTVARLAYVALIALVFWGLTSIFRSETSFKEIFISGAYAIVPAYFIRWGLRQIFTQVGFGGIPFLFTLVVITIWIVFLAILVQPPPGDEEPDTIAAFFRELRPLRGWRALIGLPALFMFTVDSVLPWNGWFLTIPLGLVTFLALVAVSLLPELTKKPEKAEPAV